TFNTVAQITVTSVGVLGDITGVNISQAGTYIVTPPNPVSVTGGTGNGANFRLTWGTLSFLNGKNIGRNPNGTWQLKITNTGGAATLNSWSLNPFTVTANPQVVDTVNVFIGGSGYTAGDIVTLNGGSATTQAQLKVTSVDNTGAVLTATIFQGGLYSSL